MSFIEIEKSIRNESWFMNDLHSHSHYEIYFLTKGKRNFFLSNSLYELSAPVIVVIPPYTMHKTEGGAFERFNANVSTKYINEFQKNVLKKKELKVISLLQKDETILLNVFEELSRVSKDDNFYDDIVNSLFGYLIFTLSEIKTENSSVTPKITIKNNVPTLVIKIIDYLNNNYSEKLTLDILAEKFYISKSTLMYNFNKHMSCTPIDYLLNVRITKAKELLYNTNKNINQIAELCGFSSANYFSLYFKEKEKLSPLNYRKHQRDKQ